MSWQVSRFDEASPDLVTRQDFGAELSEPVRTPEGFWHVEARLTRSGIFRYSDGKGNTRIEWRPPEEVAKAVPLMAGMPFTVKHPPDLLDSKSFKDHMVGTVLSAKFDGEWVYGKSVIHDEDAVNRMRDEGLRQTSQGYKCRLEFTPGVTPDGIRYDAIQRDIVPNHQSAVAKGRAGSHGRIRLDGASITDVLDGVTPMFEYTLPDGTVVKFATKAAFDAFKGQVARAEKFEAKFDAAEADKPSDADKQADWAARRKLERRAEAIAAHHGKRFDSIEEMAEREIMVAAIRMDKADYSAEGKGDGAVEGLFEFLAERVESNPKPASTETRTDSTVRISDVTGDPRDKDNNKEKKPRPPKGWFSSNAVRKALAAQAI